VRELLSEIGANTRFRDPIYGYIWLTKEELEIVDTPLFQRLRRIHQLALEKYVYPTAENSRFVHSLGVLHCATVMFAEIIHKMDPPFEEKKLVYSKCELLKLLRFAALLHDIGHIAFSHAGEDVLLDDVSHEDLSRFIINNYPPFVTVLGERSRDISSLLSSEVKKDLLLLKNIVSGQLDADRADYLLRDSYCCGVKYGEYDFMRYITSFGADMNGEQMKLIVEAKDIYVVESFLLARYHYSLQVPFHKTRMAYDITLGRYFQDKENLKLTNYIKTDEFGEVVDIDFGYLECFDDYTVFEEIKKDSSHNKWAKMLLRQDHLQCLMDLTNSKDHNEYMFKLLVKKLRKSDLEENEDFFWKMKSIDVSKFKRDSDEEDVNGADALIKVKTRDCELESITDHSLILPNLLQKTNLLRVYVTREKFKEANSILAEIKA